MPLCDTWWHLSSHFYVSHLEVLTLACLMGSPFLVIVRGGGWSLAPPRGRTLIPSFSIPHLTQAKEFQGLLLLFFYFASRLYFSFP